LPDREELQAPFVQLIDEFEQVSALPAGRGRGSIKLFLLFSRSRHASSGKGERHCRGQKLKCPGVFAVFFLKPLLQNNCTIAKGVPVEIHVTDDRLGRYFRRYQLALRLVSHGARAQTVCDWSGLTRDQLITMRRRWGFDPDEYRRGPAPSAFHVFFKTKRHRNDATLFASICRIVGVTTARTGKDAVEQLPGLENGELLCEALEVFREWQPDSDLEFDTGCFSSPGVVHAEDVAAWPMFGRPGAVLIEAPVKREVNCGFCQQIRAAVEDLSPQRRKESDGGVVDNHERAEAKERAIMCQKGKVAPAPEILKAIETRRPREGVRRRRTRRSGRGVAVHQAPARARESNHA